MSGPPPPPHQDASDDPFAPPPVPDVPDSWWRPFAFSPRTAQGTRDYGGKTRWGDPTPPPRLPYRRRQARRIEEGPLPSLPGGRASRLLLVTWALARLVAPRRPLRLLGIVVLVAAAVALFLLLP